MRILLISYYFPPYNCVGAVRPAKLAKFLERQGHEVVVLSAQNQPFLKGLELPIDASRVVYTPWLNVNSPVEYLLGGRKRVAQQGFIQSGGNRGVVKKLGQAYKAIAHVPDGQIGWLRYAVREGRRILAQNKFDMIYASAPPFTGLMVARRLAKEFDLPWVAELRDLWSDNHSYSYPRWRHLIDETIERRTMNTAAAMVTVSEPLATVLRDKYHVPAVVAMNGYDPEDFPEGDDKNQNATELKLVYTGNIYAEHNDVELLFDGIRQYCNAGGSISIDFVGRNLGDARAKATEFGLEGRCNFLPPVSHREAISRQRNADMLLFFCWQGEAQAGVYTSKLFEYLGARRPILGIGNPRAEAASMISERKAGTIADTSEVIVRALTSWAETKRQHGSLPSLPETVSKGLTRDEQFAPIQELITSLHEDK